MVTMKNDGELCVTKLTIDLVSRTD